MLSHERDGDWPHVTRRLRDRLELLEDVVARASRMAESERAGMTQKILQEAFIR